MRLTVEAIFQVRCSTPFGAEVRVVGSSEALGRWDPTRGFRLDTGAKLYPTWRSRSTSLLEDGVEYKYVVTVPGQEVRWETGPNRRLAVSRHEGDSEAVLFQHAFDDVALERRVCLRPFPDRRAFSHLRKARHGHSSLGLCARGAGGWSGCWHEEPAGGRSVLEDLGIDLPYSTDSSSGISGMTRASSTDSVSFLESEEDPARPQRQTLLVWSQSASPSGGVSSIDIYGSFTQPPWSVPLTLHLCPETGVWWISIEEALPQLQPGTYELKFLLNDHVWMVNPALPVSRNPDGMENNKLRIDYRLLTRIERKASSLGASSPKASSRPATVVFAEGVEQSREGVLEAVMEPSSRSSSNSVFGEEAKKKGRSSPTPLARRAVSTAERLHRAGSDDGTFRIAGKRTCSLPHLQGGMQSPHEVACLYDLVGSTDGGTLYDSDVALLLELPDVKRQSGLLLVGGAFYKPKGGAGEGEDGHFLEHPALGVADGVGGLQHVLGYTSKAFADELMAQCSTVARGLDLDRQRAPSVAAQQILCDGFMGVQKYGASTAAIAYLDTRSNRLGVAILGDSGVMVVRRPTSRSLEDADRMTSTRSFIVFKSPSQQHDFNYPYQLCRLPQELKKLLIRRPDMPSDCLLCDIEVEEGDLVLVYSDGVDDNLHDAEVLDICDRALSPYAAHVLGLPSQAATPPDLVSRAIGGAAYLRSTQENVRTPFAEEARKAGWPVAWCRGGKEDDITCVAAWIAHEPGVVAAASS